jgi:hypothetical protein
MNANGFEGSLDRNRAGVDALGIFDGVNFGKFLGESHRVLAGKWLATPFRACQDIFEGERFFFRGCRPTGKGSLPQRFTTGNRELSHDRYLLFERKRFEEPAVVSERAALHCCREARKPPGEKMNEQGRFLPRN